MDNSSEEYVAGKYETEA
jgi:hypothetical protein